MANDQIRPQREKVWVQRPCRHGSASDKPIHQVKRSVPNDVRDSSRNFWRNRWSGGQGTKWKLSPIQFQQSRRTDQRHNFSTQSRFLMTTSPSPTRCLHPPSVLCYSQIASDRCPFEDSRLKPIFKFTKPHSPIIGAPASITQKRQTVSIFELAQ